jgi:hypothetical protein
MNMIRVKSWAEMRQQVQGCQMVYFQTKNPNLGIFWWALECKMLLYFMTIWNILRPFGIIYGRFGICSLWSFGVFFPFWYIWTKKNLATLDRYADIGFAAKRHSSVHVLKL